MAIAPRPIATHAAFDLVATGTGAVLVWGAPQSRGAGLHVAALDGEGVKRGVEHEVIPRGQPGSDGPPGELPAQVVQVAAAAGGGRLGIAWVLREGDGDLHAWATHGDEAATTFAPPTDLGPSEPGGDLQRRGSIAVALSEGGLMDVLYRATRGPCGLERPHQKCTRFAEWRPDGHRRSVPLVVPQPCAPGLLGHIVNDGKWYYGLCARQDDANVTIVYGIQFDPEYAHAESVLSGCTPTALAPAPDGVLVTARCAAREHAVVLADTGKDLADLGAVRAQASCRDGRPVLSIRSLGGQHTVRTLKLSGPIGRIEGWLPSQLVPSGSRAVWTGDAILVASPMGPEVTVRRYQCDNGELQRTDVL